MKQVDLLRAFYTKHRRRVSQAEFAMRAKPHEFKTVIIRFALDEDEIELVMAVAVTAPFADKRMIEIAARQRLISGEQVDPLHQQSIQLLMVSPDFSRW